MKVPTPRRLKNGKWYIYMRLGGQAYPVTDANKADCVARARSIKAQYKAGELDTQPPTKAAPATLGAVIDAYIDKYAPVLSPATVRGYRTVRRCRFLGYMEREIGKIDYQAMVNAETAIAAPKTVRNAWGVVKVALKDIDFPIPKVKLPAAPVTEIPFLQPEEIKPFMDAIKDDPAELAALLMLHGLRVSEVLALTWERGIDLKACKIKVIGAIVQGDTNQFVYKATGKTTTSARSIDILIPRLGDVLNAIEPKSGPLVTMRPHVILRHIKAACNRAGVTQVGNHGLRHSAASLAYDLGWSPRMIMDFFGWSNMQTAHKIYIRVAQSRKAKDVNNMAAFYKMQTENVN